jgi:hypothetical protein
MISLMDRTQTAVDIDPVQRGLGAIGDMGYFRLRAEPLWRRPDGTDGEDPSWAKTTAHLTVQC